MTGTTLILHNPHAGRGRSAEVWQQLMQDVPELARCEAVRAGSAEGMVEALAQRLTQGRTQNGDDVVKVLALGGDGTGNLAVNGLLRAGRGDIPLGLVPAGTGSDFARHLGLPRDAEGALRHALARDPSTARVVDAIEVRTDSGVHCYAFNIASAGLSGAVDLAVNQARLSRGGSYRAAILQTLLRYGAVHGRVEVDGEPFHDGALYLVAMANAPFFGQNIKVAPDARIDDGLLDVVFIPPFPKWQLPFRLPLLFLGKHTSMKLVRVKRAKKVRIVPHEGFPPYDLDGEILPAEPATFRVLPGAIRVLD